MSEKKKGVPFSSRTALALLAGTTAGILGLTGILGFVFYIVASFFVSVRNEHVNKLLLFSSLYLCFSGLSFFLMYQLDQSGIATSYQGVRCGVKESLANYLYPFTARHVAVSVPPFPLC